MYSNFFLLLTDPEGGASSNKLIGGPPGSTPPPYAEHQQHHHHHNHGNKMTGANGGQVLLSELPEPPIPVSEIGPIPPPPMFSTPSPTLIAGRPHGPGAVNDQQHYQDYEYDGK